jgi:hypothetical protein
MSKRLYVKYPLFLSDFSELNFLDRFSKKKSLNIKFYENPSNGKGVVPCGHADGRAGGWTDMTKVIDTFRNFAKSV